MANFIQLTLTTLYPRGNFPAMTSMHEIAQAHLHQNRKQARKKEG